MKKFKVKNRKKRKYIRKISSADISSSKTAFIGITPFLSIAIAFLTTTVINANPFSTIPFHHSITFSWPTIVIPTFQLPEIAISKPDINFPEINLTPLWQTVSRIPTFVQNTLQLLNPLPFLLAISTAFFFTIIHSLQFMTTAIISGISQFIVFDVFVITNFLGSVYDAILNMWRAVQLITQGILLLSLMLYNLLLYIGKSIIVGLSFIGHKFTLAMNAISTTIQIPFKILGEYYQQIKPYLDILGMHINQSLHNMSVGFTNLSTLSSDLMKASQK